MTLTPLCTAQVTVNTHPTGGSVLAVRCKRWSCEYCREINRQRVIRIAAAAKPRALLTLTVRHSDYASPDHAAEALKRGLRLLRLRLKRHPMLQNFRFLAVFERHKSGFPHLHLLIKGKYLPWQELRKMWESITGSYMVDIRRIRTNGQAAMYVAKYIGKDLSAFEGCKRWWRSVGYSADQIDDYQVEKAGGQWSRLTAGFYSIAPALEQAGYIVEVGRGARLTYTVPETGPPPLSFIEALNNGPVVMNAWGGAL